MTEVLSPPATSQSPSPHNAASPSPIQEVESPEQMYTSPPQILSPQPRNPRPQPSERVPSFAKSRMSQYSTQSHNTSRSRPDSNAFPIFQSSLSYALVRDFAYTPFHPMHYGPPPTPPSGTTTPGSEFNGSRRMSDPLDMWNQSGSRNSWGTAPWGGDGALQDGEDGGESLPATSFGEPEDDGEMLWGPRGKHRKSKSYATMSEFERGRRRESGQRRSGAAGGNDMYFFSGPQTDPAGIDSLRHSRSGFGQHRRDSHFAATLPSRSFHHSQEPIETPLDSTSSFPLDMLHRSHSPSSPGSPQQGHRDSLGEDELFSGPSIALYDFEPENANELPLREGQEIMVSYRHGQGWLVAEDPQTGEQGLVPEEYVRLVRDLDMEQWYQDQDQDQGQEPDGETTTDDFADDDDDDDASTAAAAAAAATPTAASVSRRQHGDNNGGRTSFSAIKDMEDSGMDGAGGGSNGADGDGGGVIDHHDGDGLEMTKSRDGKGPGDVAAELRRREQLQAEAAAAAHGHGHQRKERVDGER